MIRKLTALYRFYRQKVAKELNHLDDCRAQQYKIFLIVGIPVLIYFAVLNVRIGENVLAVLISTLALSLLLTKSWIVKGKHVGAMFRFNAVLYSTVVLYLLVLGGAGGSKILWMYTFPLIAFFLVGKKEGLAWNVAVFGVAIVLLYAPPTFVRVYPYHPEFVFRFVLSYLIIASITFWFEFLRHSFRIENELNTRRLVDKQQRLEEEIARRTELEKELLTLAHTDTLSGALNRRRFWELVNYELNRRNESRRQMALLILDIDYFKRINDTYGHMTGDSVIKALSTFCQENLRTSDLFARIGGEEFAVLLTDLTPEQAQSNADRLRSGLARMQLPYADTFVTFTVSIGMTPVGPDDTCIEPLLKRADEALYEAKAGGRNRVVVL